VGSEFNCTKMKYVEREGGEGGGRKRGFEGRAQEKQN
jgi:hypothetical protein